MKRRGVGTKTLRATTKREKKMADTKDTAKDTKPAPHLVKMKRATPQRKDGPVTADVHPREVKNFEAGGWTKA